MTHTKPALVVVGDSANGLSAKQTLHILLPFSISLNMQSAQTQHSGVAALLQSHLFSSGSSVWPHKLCKSEQFHQPFSCVLSICKTLKVLMFERIYAQLRYKDHHRFTPRF